MSIFAFLKITQCFICLDAQFRELSIVKRTPIAASFGKALILITEIDKLGLRLPMATSSSSPSYSKYDTRRRTPNPKTAALLVIDMQNYFSSMADPILPSLLTTISLCRSHHIPVIFTRHRHKSADDHSMLAEWWSGDLIIDGTLDSRLLPKIDVGKDRVVEKSTYSAFHGTGLEEILEEMGVKEVIVTGVMTNLCCETTAREAFVRGFRVFFSTDATATSNREMHEAAILNLAYGFAYLVDCKRLQAGLGNKS